MINYADDTIAAISTASGEAAIAAIRISGNQAKKIAFSIINITSNSIKHKQINHAWIIDPLTNEKIDEIMFAYMQGPNSFTGEDVVEIFCHGGVSVQKLILSMLIGAGARIAENGEFTKRALLNGKLDLTKAEAIIELIHARSQKGIIGAAKRLDGKLSIEINIIKSSLIQLVSTIDAAIDFPDDVDENKESLRSTVNELIQQIQHLINTNATAKILEEGAVIAIIGEPNAGKSSLLNVLLSKSRSIVNEMPGTTTDTIEEILYVDGVPVKLIDTAGIRKPQNNIEEEGIKRTKMAIEESIAIIAMFDPTGQNEYKEELLNLISDKKHLLVMNKADLSNIMTFEEKYLQSSTKTGLNINLIRDFISDSVNKYNNSNDSLLIYSQRQISNLKGANQSLIDAAAAIEVDLVVASNCLREAIQDMQEITGEKVSEEIVNNIFDRFCIGK